MQNQNPIITMSFSVIPKIPDHLNSYDVVDRAIEVVQKSGVRYEVGAMETTLEGAQEELFTIVKNAQQACIDAGATSVITSIKIHFRPTGVTMNEKLKKYRCVHRT